MYFKLPQMQRLLAFSLLILLAACASKQDLTDPGNETLRKNLTEFFAETNAPASSAYSIKRTDLNNDGRRDALILMRNPYGYWCNEFGCKMFIFQAHDDNFTLLSTINPVRDPVYLTDDVTMGWRDIVVRLTGRNEAPKDVALRFDGQTYPENPDLLEGSPRGDIAQFGYERIFTNEGTTRED